MKSACLAMILGLLIVCGAASNCPIKQKPLIVSDSVGLSAQSNKNTNAQDLVYNYQFSDSFESTPNVAIGINQIQARQSSYLDISIAPARTTQQGIFFQAKSGEHSQWKTFQINFLASTRDDMEIGSAIINQPIANSDGTFDLPYLMKKDFNKDGMKIKSFLQGFNLESQDHQSIGLRHEKSNVIGKTVYFSFASLERKSIIHTLSICIIVFNIYTPNVLYADGIIDQNYVESTMRLTIPKHGINELRTYIVGINCFETSAAQPVSISSAIDDTFTLVIGPIDRSKIDFISVSYLVLSVIDCGSCSGFPLLYDNLCRIDCPAGTLEQSGHCIPIQCQNGYHLDSNKNCVPTCRDNQVILAGKCVCEDGFHLIGGSCRACKEGEYFDFREVACKPLCTFNSYYSQGRCFCNEGFYIINGRCQKCPYGSQYNPFNKKCQNICKGSSEIYSPEGCICRNGYHRINNECGRCPYQKVYNPLTATCDCQSGYQLVFGRCVKACGFREMRRENGYCDCAAGFFRMRDGACRECPLNSNYDPIRATCACRFPYMMMDGRCQIVCRANEYLEAQTERCVSHCPQYLEAYVNGKCECLEGYERLPKGVCAPICPPRSIRVGETCNCVAGYVSNELGSCIRINCPSGTLWNDYLQDCLSTCSNNQVWVNGRCQCVVGTSRNSYGNCVYDCTLFEIKGNDGVCYCREGYRRISPGVCAPGCHNGHGQCGGDSGNGGSGSGNSGGSHCGAGMTHNPILKRCSCDLPNVWVFGHCTSTHSCGPHQYWCGTACICKHGFYMVNGVCEPVPLVPTCPTNSVSNGVNCHCKPGTYPISNSFCGVCPEGTHWNGNKCRPGAEQCLPGYKWNPITHTCELVVPLCNYQQFWDGVRCRCKQGYHLIDNSCKKCEYGTFFDGVSCAIGGSSSVCTDPYSFFNGMSCVCLPGYWPLKDGKCVTCPEGTKWNGVCCKAEHGKYLPLVVP